MDRLNILVLALAVVSPTVGISQPRAEEQPGLELRLQPEDVQAGVPEAFTFVLVNRSNHDVRVPMPSIECDDPPFDGSIFLNGNNVHYHTLTINGTVHPLNINDPFQQSWRL